MSYSSQVWAMIVGSSAKLLNFMQGDVGLGRLGIKKLKNMIKWIAYCCFVIFWCVEYLENIQ